eukprot:evm.model.scf_39.17 EVM.evm.TU.scf_39.17   scf_39:159856-164351(-)
MEPLKPEDRRRLKVFGIKGAALGTGSDRAPLWLQKWVALILEYTEMERNLLPKELLALPSSVAVYNGETAAAQAKGVCDNRLQNIAITLDKVRMCLRQPGQTKTHPLRFLTDEQTTDYLWANEKSVARRAVRCCLPDIVPVAWARKLKESNLDALELARFGVRHGCEYPTAAKLFEKILEDASCAKDAKRKLLDIVEILRMEDMRTGGFHTACADILQLYANTHHYFAMDKTYTGFTSRPLRIPLNSISGLGVKKRPPLLLNGTYAAEGSRESTENSPMAGQETTTGRPQSDLNRQEIEVSKKYPMNFIWAQLSFWFKQTVTDPTASLSADRRGSICLPDIESCYNSGRKDYHKKDRPWLLELLENKPDAMWKFGTIFSFRSEAKIYGSPMVDAVWRGDQEGLQRVVAELKSASVPGPS